MGRPQIDNTPVKTNFQFHFSYTLSCYDGYQKEKKRGMAGGGDLCQRNKIDRKSARYSIEISLKFWVGLRGEGHLLFYFPELLICA